MRRVIAYACQALGLIFGGCASVPQGLEPVGDFKADRYLGTWYEIARLDHSFERGLSKVTAEYSMRSDGSIQVVNRGYDARRGKWQEARGVLVGKTVHLSGSVWGVKANTDPRQSYGCRQC